MKRENQILLEAGRPFVAEYVRKILSQNPPYQLLKETEPNRIFEVRFKPYWWVEPAYMKISLLDEQPRTRVAVLVKSSWYIFGDAFAFYDKLIEDFKLNLRNHIEGKQPENQFVYRYPQDIGRFLQLLGFSMGVVSVVTILIGLAMSIFSKVILISATILFVCSALLFRGGIYIARQHK